MGDVRGKFSGRNFLGFILENFPGGGSYFFMGELYRQNVLVGSVWDGCLDHTKDFKYLCPAVMICATLVNTQTHTDRTHYTISSAR